MSGSLLGFSAARAFCISCHTWDERGRHLSEAFCHAPLLDILVSYFIILPLVAGSIVAGWRGLIIAPLAMFATLLVWQTIHEAVHRKTTKGPRIIKVINKKFGALRNLTAIYVIEFRRAGLYGPFASRS